MAMRVPARGVLARHIVVVLALKLVMIVLLWMAFFDEPQDEHLTREQLQVWMLGQPVDRGELVDGQ